MMMLSLGLLAVLFVLSAGMVLTDAHAQAADTTAPRPVAIVLVDGNTIVLTASETLAGSATVDNFGVTYNFGSHATITNVLISENTVTITLTPSIPGSVNVAFSYSGGTIADGSGNLLGSLFDVLTINAVDRGPRIAGTYATGGPYKTGDMFDINMIFNKSVTVIGEPQLTLETGTTDATATYFSGSPGNTLVFRYTVVAGHNSDDLGYVSRDSLTLNGGTVTATDDGENARLRLQSPNDLYSLSGNSNVIVDGLAPTFSSAATTNANTIVITASEPLGGDTADAVFTVSGNPVTVDPVISESTITLTVNTAIVGGTPVTVDYAGTSITDAIGNTLETFTGQPVTNNEVDAIAPTVVITSTTADNGDVTASRTISYIATFDEIVTGFDTAADDIVLTGTATAAVNSLAGTDTTYTFDVDADTEGTVIVTIPAGAAADTSTNDNTVSDPYTVTVSDIVPIRLFDLPDNGYRHNLTHLTGNYYVSSHTVSSIADATNFGFATVLRLYSIIDGQISMIGTEQIVNTLTQAKTTTITEFTTNPRSTAIARVDDSTIAVSYVGSTTASSIATYDVDTGSNTPFRNLDTHDFITTTNNAGGQTYNHSLIALDADTLVIGYQFSNTSPRGLILTVSIDTITGELGNSSSFTIGTSTSDVIGQYISMAKLDADTLVIAYRGGTSDSGFIQALTIAADNTITGETAAAEHEGQRTSYNSLIRVDDDTVAVAYSRIDLDTSTSDGQGRIKVFDVNSDDTITGRGGPVYYDTVADVAIEEHAHHNSMALLDSNTLAVAYRGADADGFIRLYDINHTTGGLTAVAGPYEHDTADGAFNSLVRIDDETLALVYGGDLPSTIVDSTATPNRITTFAAMGVDTTPPVIESAATTNETTIVLVASQPLAGTTTPGVFEVPSNNVTAAVISDSTITLTVGTAIVGGTTVTVNYTGATITDVAENVLATFTGQPVTNNVILIPVITGVSAPTATYKAGDVIDITVAFNVPVAVIGTGIPQLLLDVGTPANRAVDYISNTGSTMLFQYTVVAGDNSDDLNYVNTSSLTAITDSIQSVQGPAVLTLPATTSDDSLGGSDVIVDTTAPTVTISTATPDNGSQNGNTISYTAEFTEQVTGFVQGDITVTGTASGGTPAVTNFATVTTGITYTFDVVTGDDGTVLVSIAADVAADTATNGNEASGIYTVTVDTAVPTVMLGSTTTTMNGGTQNTDTISYTVLFTEPVTNFVESNIMISGTASGNSPEVSSFAGGDASYTFNVVTSSDGTVVVSIPAGVATDAAGNLNTESLMFTITVDTAVPTVAITTATANGGSQNTNTISYTATFSEQVTGFVQGDITVTGTASGGTPAVTNFATVTTGITYTFDVVTGDDGTVEVTIPEGVAADTANNGNMASAIYTVTVDTALPMFMSAQTTTPNTIEIIISEPLDETMTAGIFTVGSNTVTGTVISGSTITITVGMAITSGDTLTVLYTAADTGGITDIAGNALATFANPQTVTNNVPVADAPEVTRVSAPTGTHTTGATIDITVRFDEEVDVTNTPTLTLDTGAVVNYSSGTGTIDIVFQYTVLAGHNSDDLNYVGINSLSENDGSITANDDRTPASLILPATTAATSLGGSSAVVVDTVAPTVTIAATGTPNDSTQNTATVSYTATFNEPVMGFALAEIGVSGTASGGSPVLSNFDVTSETVYTFDVVTIDDGIVQVIIPPDAAMDAAGNGNTGSAIYTVTVDTEGANVILSTGTMVDGTQNTDTISYHVFFNDVVTGFIVDDITVTGTASNGTPTASNFVTVTTGTTYTFDVVTTSDGTVTVTIPANVAEDAAGNGNDVSRVYTVTVDTTAPTIMSAATSGSNMIVLTASEPLDETMTAGTFTVATNTVSGTPVISGSTITITVGMAITSGDTLTVSYTTDTGGIADIAGNALETFANPETVTNNVPDATAPTVVSVSAPPGTHTTGATIDITVAFDEAVDVTGTPQLTLETGSTDAIVGYTSGTGTINLVFQYTVAATHTSTDLNYVGTTSLALNGGTINVAGGTTAANLALPALTASESLGGSSAVIVDTTAPTVTISNDQTTASGETATTRTLTYTATFTESVTGFEDAASDITASGTGTATAPAQIGTSNAYTFTVTVTGDETLTVSIPAGAAADAAENGNTASADYTVTVDATPPTIMSAATSGSTTIVITASEPLAEITPTGVFTVTGNTVTGTPTISGSTITIIVGTSIVFGDTPAVTYVGTDLTDVAGNALEAITNRTVTNNVPVAGVPVVTGVAAPPGTHNAGDTINITVTFDQSVTLSGVLHLTLETGDNDAVVVYTSNTPGTELAFQYTVAAGHNSADLNYVDTTPLALSSGTLVATTGGAAAVLTLPATTDATSLGGSSAVVVDAVVPTVTISASVDNDGNTNDGSVFYTATFSEDVTGFGDVAADITVSGTAAATLTTPTGSGSTYTFAATTTNGGTITVLIPADAATDTATNGNTASATYTVTVNSLSQINSLDLTPGGYRHNLVHFTGDYYVSSHTVTRANSDDAALWNFDTVLNLYSIIGGDITLIGSRTVETRTQDKTTTINEFTTHPRSTAVTAVDDDTIAVTYVAGSTSRLRTYDVDTASTTAPFGVSVLTSIGIVLDGQQTHNHSLVTLDATRLVVAYSYPDASPDNYIQIISIDPDNGALSLGTVTALGANNNGQYSSLVKLDDDTVIVAYRGDTQKAYLQAVDILADDTITVIDAVEHDSRRTAYHSLVRVDSDTVAVAYSAIGDAALADDGHGTIKVFDVTSSGGFTGRTNAATYQTTSAAAEFEEQVHINSLALLDSDTLALAYRGDDADGFIRLYDISSTGLTARGDPFEHDTANGAFNSLVSVNDDDDDDTLALVYGGDLPSVIANTDTPNTIKTLAVLGPDTTVPTIVAAVTSDANTIVLTASEFLARTAATPVFTVPGNAVTGTVILGTTVTITVDTQISLGDTPTINYAVGDAITDAAGNALAAFAALPVTNNVDDATRPTAIITNADIADGDTTLTDTTASYTVTFNEPVPGFDVADIIISGTASGGAPVPSNFETATADISYTFDVVTTSDGTVIVSVPENVAADPAGNQNAASNTYTITVDAEVPEIISARLSTDTITIIYNKLVTTERSHYDDVMPSAGLTPTIDSFADVTPTDASYTTISLTLSVRFAAGTTATIDIAGPTKTSDSTSALSPLEDYPVTAEVNVVLDATDNRIAVTDFDSTLATVIYPSTVDATLDYSSLIDGESVTPTATTNNEIVVTATGIRGGNIQVTIPAFTSFSSSTFDGILILPTDSGSGCDSTAITSGAQASCIEIGQAGSVINTDKPIRIQLGGQAGNVPWYSEGGAVATQIIAACTADDLTPVSAQLDGTGECFINTDRDLIIWTAHFTVFGSNLVTPPSVVVVEPEPEPTPASEPAPRRSGGGGHGNTLDARVCGGVLCSEQGSNNQSSGTPSTSRSSGDQIRTVPPVTPEQTQEPDRTQNDADSMVDVPEPTPTPTDPESGAMMDPEPTPPPMDPEPGAAMMDPEPGAMMDPEPGAAMMDPEPGAMMDPEPGAMMDPEPTPPPMDPEPTPPPMDPEPGSTAAPESSDGILEQIGKWFTSLFG